MTDKPILPPDEHLRKQARPFDDTLSAFAVMKEVFFTQRDIPSEHEPPEHPTQPEDVRKLVEEYRAYVRDNVSYDRNLSAIADRLANALTASVAPRVAARLRELAACFNRGTISKDLCDLAARPPVEGGGE